MIRVLAVAAMLASGSPVVLGDTTADADLEALEEWMSGSCSSRQPSVEDPGYLEIRLQAVWIWPDRAGEGWLFLEQASEEALDRPCRQRIYRVGRRGDARLEGAAFELPGPSIHVGTWWEPERLESPPLANLRPGEGCGVILGRRPESRFEDSVSGNACVGGLRGASCASSPVVLEADVLRSWDRSLGQDGMQVWGSAEAPYTFRGVTADTSR
jgi:hypothetical protein